MQHTEEQLSRMSFQERKNAVELMELEAQFEAARPDSDPVVPVETANEPAPIPEVTPEVSPETSQVTETKESVEPEMNQETLDYWKQEADKWKKRKADADRALSPAQQKAAKAKKELDTKEVEWKSIALSLQEKFDALEKKLAQPVVNSPAHDSYVSPEFEENYGEIASEMKRMTGGMEERFQKVVDARFSAIEERNKQIEMDQLRVQDGAYATSHYAQLKALHPDIDDFVNPDKKGTQLFDWATEQPPYVRDIVINPLNYTPLDVSDVLNRFKKGNEVVTKKPSLGDVMVKAHSTPNIPQPEDEGYLSDHELKHFDELMRHNRLNPTKMSDLVKRYEATLTRNQ